MQEEPTDEALMLAYGAGDVGAFQTLYARHRGPLFRHLTRQLRDAALAEEFFQDTWQRVIAAAAGWKPDAAFRTWLFRIARNLHIDRFRREPTNAIGNPRDADIEIELEPDGCRTEDYAESVQLKRRIDALSSVQGRLTFSRTSGPRAHVKALFAFDGIVGSYASPWTPGRPAARWTSWPPVNAPASSWPVSGARWRARSSSPRSR